MDVALNELTFGLPGDDMACREAARRLVRLLQALNAEARMGVRLLLPVPIRELMLSETLSLQAWLGDPAHREEARRLKGFLQRAATFGAVQVDESPRWDLLDFAFDNQRAIGLGIAADRDGIGVSLVTDPPWDTGSISLVRQELTEEGELASELVVVRHASRPEHVATHTMHLRTWVVEPSTPADLWANRSSLYPHLRWCSRVESQISGLDIGAPHFTAIRRRLRELDTAAAGWEPAAQLEPTWLSLVTPEHQTRKALCWFDDDQGTSRCFHVHARFNPGAGRIHVWPDPERGVVVVGHVGLKLGI